MILSYLGDSPDPASTLITALHSAPEDMVGEVLSPRLPSTVALQHPLCCCDTMPDINSRVTE